MLASWDQVQALRYTTIGLACNAVASGTEGLYGSPEADLPRMSDELRDAVREAKP